jgi:hypothetical protein
MNDQEQGTPTKDQEEKELRDAFRVSSQFFSSSNFV